MSDVDAEVRRLESEGAIVKVRSYPERLGGGWQCTIAVPALVRAWCSASPPEPMPEEPWARGATPEDAVRGALAALEAYRVRVARKVAA
jgi:hypothetical protein